MPTKDDYEDNDELENESPGCQGEHSMPDEDQEIESKVQKSKKIVQDTTYIDFLSAKLDRKDQIIFVKTVVHGKFYRVNFYKEVAGGECIILKNLQMVDSMFIEVLHKGKILDFVDLTIRPKKIE